MTDIIIADSHEIVREGIARRLTEDCGASVVGQAEDGYTAIKLTRNCSPDIILLDLALSRPSGMDTFRKLRTVAPDLKILVLSSEASISTAFTTLALGAVGFMPRQASGDHFVTAIRTIEMGYTFMPSDYLSEFVALKRNVSRSGNIFGLSPRELEVLEASSGGTSTKEIAERLEISVRTVETHRNAIYRKTDCKSLADLNRTLRSA